jgi:hypothetical protein
MGHTPDHKFDDEDYPAYTMGRAADMIGATHSFLRSLDEAKLITPQRSAAGTAATHAANYAWPNEPATWSSRVPRWKPPAASSPSKTKYTKHANSSTPTDDHGGSGPFQATVDSQHTDLGYLGGS